MSIASKDIIDLYEIYQNLNEGPNNPPKVVRDEQKKVKCKDGSMAVDCTVADAEWEKQQKSKEQNNTSTNVTQDNSTTDTKTTNTNTTNTNTNTTNSNGARVDGGIKTNDKSDLENKLAEKERLRKEREEQERNEATKRAREKLEKQNKTNETDTKTTNTNTTDTKTTDTKEVDDYLGKAEGLKDKDQWLKDTANSPAARSGAFKPEERWAQQLKHRQWQKDNNRGAFKVKKEKSKVYTNKVDAFLNNKKVGDPKGTNNYKILSPLEQEMESFDAYDSVMSYLMGTSQAESIEEANHIMMEMDGKTIMEIKKIMNESQINRADIRGGSKAVEFARQGKGNYTPGAGVTKDFQLDPNFKIKA